MKNLILFLCFFSSSMVYAQHKKVIGFFTAKNDLAHISFVNEAHKWWLSQGESLHFQYDSTSDWSKMTLSFLQQYDLVLFLDTRPELPEQRLAFENYMKNGGAWMGFHFAAFALNNSDFPQDWDWYHKDFLGSDEYKSNTWRPTSAILKVENPKDTFVKDLPSTFKSAPNEWYCWTGNLRKNKDIEVLLSIDPSSFPLGTGPKEHEIWHAGDYPVAWTNKKYRMLYMNMGHNDMDYDQGTNATLSSSFSSSEQNHFIRNGINTLIHE